MDIENKIDIWQNEGGDPGGLKQKGFEGGYYPPANIFNWLFNRHSVAIDELQNLLQALSVDDIGAANNKLDNLENPTEASGNLLYRGTINASNAKKADTYTNIGIYKVYLDGVSGSDFNFPTPYGIFVVEAAMDGTSYDYVAQAFYSMGDNKFFTRTSSDNGATWLDWKQAASHTDLVTHTANKKNPHTVTCEQLGAVRMENAIAAGTNLDTVIKSGMYRINESPANAPADVAYGQMLVVHGGNDTIAQIVFPYNQSRMFFRTGNPSNTGGTGTWKDWTQVYTSFNKPTPADIGAFSKSDIIPVSNGGTGANNKTSAFEGLIYRDSIKEGNILNCNTLTNSGVYRVYITDGNTATTNNFPARYGLVYVNSVTGYIEQTFYDVSGFKSHMRYSSNGGSTWSDWKKIYDTTNKPTPEEIGAAEIVTGTYTGNSESDGSEQFIDLGFTPSSVEVYPSDGVQDIWVSGLGYQVRGGFALKGHDCSVTDGTVTKKSISIVDGGFKVYEYYKNGANYEISANGKGLCYYYKATK